MPLAVSLACLLLLAGAAAGLCRHLRNSAKGVAEGAAVSLLFAGLGAAVAAGVLILATGIVVDVTWFDGTWGHVGYEGAAIMAALAALAEVFAAVTYARRDRPDSITLRCGLVAFVEAGCSALLAVGVTLGT